MPDGTSPSDCVVALLLGDDGETIGSLHARGQLGPAEATFVHQVGELLTVGLTRDRREMELLKREQRLIEAQRISLVGSYDFEIATNTNLWSDQLYRIYGREPQSFNASYEQFLEMIVPEDREHVIAVHQRSLQTLEPFEMEERIRWPDGQVRTLASWGEIVSDADGNPTRMMGICWDITERKQMEEQLVREALHDSLTGLPNRALLVDRLTQAIAGLPRRGGPLCVIFVDVDRFKVINDSLGHEAGDEVLVELAKRFSSVLRPGDTVARFGGDEFVVLSEELADDGEALTIAERLQNETNRPISVQDSEVMVTVSVGIAVSRSFTNHPSALLRDADAAMYRAKRGGRDRSVVFADEMRDEAIDRHDTEQQLRRAVSDDQLVLHYQPIVELATGRVTGVEALVRWQHPTRGLVPPGEFIPIAEEIGLIVQIDDWVLEHACQQLTAWQATNPELTMSINLSGLQFARPDLVSLVAGVLESTGANPERVALEMTEGVLMRDAEDAVTVLRDLRRLGVRLDIDDFGTGYSSLSYLRRFPVDTLKVDSSFVSGLGGNAEDRAIVQSVVALAQSLGITTIAEGVETTKQLQVLRDLGCKSAQGFLFSRPLPPQELTQLVGIAGVVAPLP
ncbi:diguanylate cyclase (GGDEF)-like protein/PAS domain S-box-containing protein [Aeromicrobium panaciterrae]|uniref:Diguanylate cyclase (GGDEF)-like protein/PAS domain S-box-containing protein n=1 Tax=Aeromicrobium panaciterrae TaxID=363861 RepID=A0ABU1UPJ7_9ACTN|nr:EAL domain-containing protein [Aeromicrobium panaciterrae]MDR7087108.1 diguanylate cyclase (GGDEF)-like protein/PAS domain S-box-containing protein [Aeromicrobium panaciterrae]